MARRAGRNGRIYLALASGGTPEPLAYQASWSINFTTPKINVTAMGDSAEVTVAGLPACTGQFAGFYDDVTAQAYTAATDGVARGFYLYPDLTNKPARYFFGSINPDVTFDSSASDAVKVSSSWSNAGAAGIQFVG